VDRQGRYAENEGREGLNGHVHRILSSNKLRRVEETNEDRETNWILILARDGDIMLTLLTTFS
jgi:hypothetical protein